jgi:fructokinase
MNYTVFGIGELLWDLLPAGRQMGGAPANFAYHARALGAGGRVVSRVGDDELGRDLIGRLEGLGVPVNLITVDPIHGTGTVSVQLASNGQPCYTIHEGVAWDHLMPDAKVLESVASADAVCFGTLAQRCEPSRSTIRQLVAHSPATAVRVFDVNLRQDFYSQELLDASSRIANVVKLNDVELPVVSELLGFRGSQEDQMRALLDHYELRLVACTRGANGSAIWDGTTWCEVPGTPTKVVDTIGAGDSFTAAITLGMLANWELNRLGNAANQIATYVCSCAGGTPPLPQDLRALFLNEQTPQNAA